MKKSYISPSLLFPPSYAHIVQVNGRDIFFSAGAVPLDASGALVGGTDIKLQTQRAVENMQTVLAEQGLQNSDVVKLMVYIVGDTSTLSAAWNELVRLGIANSTIAATLLGVTYLGYQGQLIEIEVIAAKETQDD